MNVILLTVLALGGTGGEGHAAGGDAGNSADDAAYVAGHGHARHLHGTTANGHCMGPMPLTCYDPPYGCYHGSRWNHRYPAFHGTYYRKAYNYRNYFDYPWHAQLHEPTSQWSYNVTGDTGAPPPLPQFTPERSGSGTEQQVPPPPVPSQASGELPLMEEIRVNLAPVVQARDAGNSLRTLRR